MSTHAEHEPQPAADYVTTEELIRRQGVAPVRSIDELADDDPFRSDEEHEAFLADLYASRHAGS
jgi:hypothetical protein